MQQTMSRPQPNMPPNNQNGGPARTQSLIITAITLFALSGLIVGFAAGAVTRPKNTAQVTPTTQTIQTNTGQKAQPTAATPQATPQQLGCPIINQADRFGVADGTTIHTLQMYAVDKSGTCAQSGKAIQQPGITCKLWLTKSTDEAKNGVAAVWTNINAIKQPIKGEVEDALTFTDTQQTQMCNSQGQATWKFSISPNVKHGNYFQVVLTDWDGKFYNLSWWPLTVTKAS
jgi:hypothetical protein